MWSVSMHASFCVSVYQSRFACVFVSVSLWVLWVCLSVCLSVPSSTDKTVNPRTLKFWLSISQVKVGKWVSQIFEFSFFCGVMAFFDISAIYSILNFDSDNRHIGTWFFASRVKMSFWNSKKKCVHKKCLLTYFLPISIFWGVFGLSL